MNYAVISTDAALRAAIAEALEDGRLGMKLASSLGSPVSSLGKDVADDLRRAGVQVVVLDLQEDPSLGLRFAKFLSEEIQGITFVLIGPGDVPPALLLEAMRVGATEYLKAPYEFAELSAALGRAARRLGAAPAPEAHEPGRVFTFISGKGGAGVTTAAANFAVRLQDATHQSTLLLDLDLDLGGSAVVLGLTPRYSISDFVRNLHRMDRNLMESLVDRHGTGVDLLASPAQPNGTETVPRDQLRTALGFLRRHYENIVIDAPRIASPVAVTALERSDDVMVMTTPDLPSLRNTKKILPHVRRAVPGGDGKIHLVVNRASTTDLIQKSDVQEALGMEVFWSLSSDVDNLTESVNEGRPVMERLKSKYTKDMTGLVEQLVTTTNGKGSPGGLSGLLRFRRSGKE